MPSQSGPSNHCLSRFLWSSAAMQFMFKNCFGCVVWNYSCQKSKVCLFMILTQIGLYLVIPLFSCHFWNNSNFPNLVLPTARTTCLCQFNGPDLKHFLEKPIKKVGTCKIIRRILTWWTLDRDVLCHSQSVVGLGICGMNQIAKKKKQLLGWTR